MVAPAQYTEVEAARIKQTLSTLTVAQLKERFDGHGVSWRWFGGMRKEAIIHHLIAGRYTNLDGHPSMQPHVRPPVDQSLLVWREAAK
jgi:hypothetical protein